MDVGSVLYHSLGRRFNPLLRVRKGTQTELQQLTGGLIMVESKLEIKNKV